MSAEAAAGASPIEQLVPKVEHLIKTLDPLSIMGSKVNPVKLMWNDIAVSTYTVFFFIALILTLVLVFAAKKRIALVPKGRFINAFEVLVEFVRNNIVKGCIHHNAERYVPFIATIFFFVLVNNLIGLIPGSKPGTGTIAGTLAIALTVFVYFTAAGVKAKGGFGYLKGIVPHGLPVAIVPLIFVIEFVSMLLRPVTQALRLFANMYAGHIVLGIFAIMTELFFMAPFHGEGALNALASPIWMVLLIAMYALEVAVAFIQAYVFTLLTAVYIDSATSEH